MDNLYKSNVKLNVSNLKLIIWYSVLINRNIKKIIADIKDLVIGLSEILSSIIPTIKIKKNVNNKSIASDSLLSFKKLVSDKLLKKISKTKIKNMFKKQKIPPFNGVGYLCNFLLVFGISKRLNSFAISLLNL